MGQLFTNNATAILQGNISAVDTQLTVTASLADLFKVATTSNWGSPLDWYKVTLEDNLGNTEIVKVGIRTLGSGILSNLLRGQDGTTARNWNAGANVSARFTADDLNLAVGSAAALEAKIAGTGVGQGANAAGYKADAVGATDSTVSKKLSETKSLRDFITNDAIGESLRAAIKSGTYTPADRVAMLAACNLAWTSALAAPHDIHAPAGRYEIGDANFPWRQTANPTTFLLDCKNVSIVCDGPATIFATYTPDGADVFQLNGLKNFHVRGFPTLTSTLTGFLMAGCNGVSIVGGYDNITLEIAGENLPSLDKGANIDGGKALSIQCGTTLLEVGTLVAKVRAKNCAMGFDFAGSLVGFLTKKVDIDVELVAENCYTATTVGNAEAVSAIPAGTRQKIKVRGSAINCQKDVVLGRAHGIDVDMHVVTTKTAAQRRLDGNAVAWLASDAVVEALLCTYAHHSRIRVTGDKGGCDYKARIGGISAGASGLFGSTLDSNIELDISGAAVTGNVVGVNSGGNIMLTSVLTMSPQTTTVVDPLFSAAIRNNVINLPGQTGASILQGGVRFAATQISSADPNTIDDYKEGTWVPTLTDSSLVDEGATYSTRQGYYTKEGNMVHWTLTIVLTGLGTLTPANSAFVTGLPYLANNATGNNWSGHVGQASGLALSSAATIHGTIAANQDRVQLRKWLATSTTGDAPMLISDVSATGLIIMSGSYRTAT